MEVKAVFSGFSIGRPTKVVRPVADLEGRLLLAADAADYAWLLLTATSRQSILFFFHYLFMASSLAC